MILCDGTGVIGFHNDNPSQLDKARKVTASCPVLFFHFELGAVLASRHFFVLVLEYLETDSQV